jgi:hypothetical protein
MPDSAKIIAAGLHAVEQHGYAEASPGQRRHMKDRPDNIAHRPRAQQAAASFAIKRPEYHPLADHRMGERNDHSQQGDDDGVNQHG